MRKLILIILLFSSCKAVQLGKESKFPRNLSLITGECYQKLGRPKKFIACFSTSSWVSSDCGLIYYGKNRLEKVALFYFPEYVSKQYILKGKKITNENIYSELIILDTTINNVHSGLFDTVNLKSCLVPVDENLIDDGATIFFYNKNSLLYKGFQPLRNDNRSVCREYEKFFGLMFGNIYRKTLLKQLKLIN